MSAKKLRREGTDNVAGVEDRRSEPRCGSARTVEVAVGSMEAPALVMDISAHGIGLITRFKIETEAQFTLKFAGLTATYTVAYCGPHNRDCYRIGARLAAGDSAAILESLRAI